MANLIYDTETRTCSYENSYKGNPLVVINEKDPILRKISEPFDFNSTEYDPSKLSADLISTCQKYHAYGISAPQVGILKRVFVTNIDNKYYPIFNPEIIYQEGQIIHENEFCLSFQNLMLSIPRYSKITVNYQNELGQHKTLTLNEIYARIFLHEFDHLNGKLFIDHVKPVALSLARKKQLKLNKIK